MRLQGFSHVVEAILRFDGTAETLHTAGTSPRQPRELARQVQRRVCERLNRSTPARGRSDIGGRAAWTACCPQTT